MKLIFESSPINIQNVITIQDPKFDEDPESLISLDLSTFNTSSIETYKFPTLKDSYWVSVGELPEFANF